jgi:hypothetical protein
MKLAACSLLVLLSASPVHAVTVDCQIVQNISAWGWFAPNLKLKVNMDTSEAIVIDDVSKDKQGKAPVAEIESNSDSKTVFKWTVTANGKEKQFRAKGETAGLGTFSKVRFKLVYFKETGQASISALAGLMYLPEPKSNGNCRIYD